MLCSFLDCVFFFFKQKTAYEMRISDWSSDVCSSDLADPVRIDKSCGGKLVHRILETVNAVDPDEALQCFGPGRPAPANPSLIGRQQRIGLLRPGVVDEQDDIAALREQLNRIIPLVSLVEEAVIGVRSEEHTSELQSLMRISYAVYCLTKKMKYQ